LFDELKKALAERVLNAEIDDHLDNEAGEGRKNHLIFPTGTGGSNLQRTIGLRLRCRGHLVSLILASC
jgi:transposase-like protein